MITLLAPLALVVTILLALAFGIVSGYFVIYGILYLFSRNRTGKSAAPVLVPSATGRH